MTASKEVFRSYLQSEFRKVMSFQSYLALVVKNQTGNAA